MVIRPYDAEFPLSHRFERATTTAIRSILVEQDQRLFNLRAQYGAKPGIPMETPKTLFAQQSADLANPAWSFMRHATPGQDVDCCTPAPRPMR